MLMVKIMQTGVTNNHFKLVINEVQDYLNKDEDVPQELFIDFVGELKYTNLLLPAVIEGDDLIFENLTSDEDDSTVLPLYTDEVEFDRNYDETSDYEPLANDIEYYVELVCDQEFDGILINQNSQDFFIGRDLLENMPFGPEITIEDDAEGYDPKELLDVAKNAANDSLEKFIKSGNNQFEALMLELAKATLLNVVASDDDIQADDGIVSIDDVDDFELCTTNDGVDEYGILFTSLDAINDTKGEGNFYCQVTLLDDFIDFVLRSDMAGIIINPGLDDYLISREYLIEAFGGLTYSNPKFKNAPDYMFEI